MTYTYPDKEVDASWLVGKVVIDGGVLDFGRYRILIDDWTGERVKIPSIQMIPGVVPHYKLCKREVYDFTEVVTDIG